MAIYSSLGRFTEDFLKESSYPIEIFKRSDHGDILVRSNDEDSALIWIDSKMFVHMAVAVVVAFVVNE